MTRNSAHDATRFSSGKVMMLLRTAAPHYSRSPLFFALMSMVFMGCGTNPSPKPEEPIATKPAEPAVPAEIQSAADALLGAETKVLAFGDLAKNGKQQVLVANVVPKTPKDSIPGTIITRAVIAQNEDGKWAEVFRCDEHLKNSKGYLGMTLYLTPVKGMDDRHVLPIGVRWNEKTKRYQSLDRTYEQFLLGSPTLSNTRSQLR